MQGLLLSLQPFSCNLNTGLSDWSKNICSIQVGFGAQVTSRSVGLRLRYTCDAVAKRVWQ